MHETEAELAKKTEELVESEKKATLGNLATEMAHEIQNPLNFVNNFSEMNEELLQEMKTELEKTNVSEEVKTVLKDLIENSQRINSNGKRVSKIVSALQERVNKQ
jgi:C4-dicarboxylate-specific signal transduction histidine kinase